jgi:hypothetical protein
MPITSTYVKDATTNLLVETTGTMLDPVMDVFKAPFDAVNAANAAIYVTKQRAAVQSVLSSVITGGAALFYQAYRYKNHKPPIFAGTFAG